MLKMRSDAYTAETPSVTFNAHGKLIAIHPKKLAVNALSGEFVILKHLPNTAGCPK